MAGAPVSADGPASIPNGLAPYLGGIDTLPDSAVVPGSVFPLDPVSQANESVKQWLSRHDVTYAIIHGVNLVSTPRRVSDPAFGAMWSGQAFVNFGLLDQPALGETMGWISTETDWTLGLGSPAESQFVPTRIGSTLQPAGTQLGQGIWIAELAWHQSFLDGAWALAAGMMDQGNYLDLNRYANNPFLQLSNEAFVNNQALPTPGQGLAVNLQWQPHPRFYAEVSSFTTASSPGSAPFSGLSFRNWATQFEAGWVTPDLLGMGPGTIRLQPFVATVEGNTGVGIGLNFEQRLGGPQSHWGWFGRFGICEAEVAVSGFQSQVSTGITLELTEHETLHRNGHTSCWSLGGVWGQPADSAEGGEYGLELLYCLQLTPTVSLRPDLQLLWIRTGVPAPDPAVVLQFQLTMAW